MEDSELWKEITEYPNYEISTFGRVKNINTGKILKNNFKCGYEKISLVNTDNRKSFSVHRLVALAFIENPANKKEVNHKDKNKINNCINNLEWMTRKENNIHRCENLVITCNKNKPVLRIDKNTNEILEKYNSIEDAGIWLFNNNYTKTIHNGRNSVGNCLSGLSKTALSFIWNFENKNEDLENEIWKKVIVENMNNDKEYFVSNLGRFKNNSGIIMSNYKVNENGYFRVYIYNKTYALHRLVAIMFIENPENKEQVNHIDGKKLNNNVENLEWVTNKANQIHKYKIGLGNNFTRKIGQYDLNNILIKEFTSIIGASKELNIGKSNITGVLIRYRKTAGGYIFKYLE